jgi:hypothetical protein
MRPVTNFKIDRLNMPAIMVMNYQTPKNELQQEATTLYSHAFKDSTSVINRKLNDDSLKMLDSTSSGGVRQTRIIFNNTIRSKSTGRPALNQAP